MERLTKRSSDTTHENGVCCTHFGGTECCAVEGNCAAECPWEEAAWERLASYEDANVTPEEAKSLASLFNYVIEEYPTMVKTVEYLRRLRKIAEADKDGRVVVMPCKVGDTVYRVFTANGREPVIQATQVKTLGQAADLIGRVGKLNKLVSVFLTREEAERKLEEMRNA